MGWGVVVGGYFTTMVWCIENIQVKPSRVVGSKVGVMLLSVQDGGERQGGGYVECSVDTAVRPSSSS